MRIIYLIGSPKKKMSTSAALLDALGQRLKDNEPIYLTTDMLTAENTAEESVKIAALLSDADALVVGFPLYVDGIPSHLLRLMEALEKVMKKAAKELSVYSVINCGFYEPEHPLIAADMTALWCKACGFEFKRALLVGGGGMGPMLANDKGPGKKVGASLDVLANSIMQNEGGEPIKVTPGFPRKLYIAASHMGWKRTAKKRGVRPKDLTKAADAVLEQDKQQDSNINS